jgi:lipoate-protein ligase B
MQTTQVEVKRWGVVPYAEAMERQLALVAARKGGEIGDQLILVEHPPIYTMGARKEAEKHLLWSSEEMASQGIKLVKTNRGGDITYHGPGQLVAYPIMDLGERRDLHAYLRDLEEVVILTLHHFGIEGRRREGLTGIWCEERKIAAIGVAVKSWVSYHGFALNVAPDLGHFAGIVPCGISTEEGSVTSMALELGKTPVWQAVEAAAIAAFLKVFTGNDKVPS